MGKRIFSVIATWVTLGALILRFYVPNTPLNVIDWLLVCVFAVGFLVFVVLEYQEYKKTSSFRKDDKPSINSYMHKWISRGDRVAIFTRDMTWAHDSKIRDLLIIKASRHELTLFLPKLIPMATELQGIGAEVFTYQKLDIEPTSRFTVINYGKGDAQVAIGRAIDDKHVIEEFSADSHPVFHVAMDLTNILKCIHQKSTAMQ